AVFLHFDGGLVGLALRIGPLPFIFAGDVDLVLGLNGDGEEEGGDRQAAGGENLAHEFHPFFAKLGPWVNRIIDESDSAGNKNPFLPEGDMRAIIIGTLAVAVGFFGSARADEEKVPLDKVPKPVLEAAKKRFPDAKFTEASKEDENGKTTYELTF